MDHGVDSGRLSMPTVDVLERVLARGIVISYDAQVALLGLPVIAIDGHTIVASVETYGQMTEPATMEGETSEALMSAASEYLSRLPSAAPVEEEQESDTTV